MMITTQQKTPCFDNGIRSRRDHLIHGIVEAATRIYEVFCNRDSEFELSLSRRRTKLTTAEFVMMDLCYVIAHCGSTNLVSPEQIVQQLHSAALECRELIAGSFTDRNSDYFKFQAEKSIRIYTADLWDAVTDLRGYFMFNADAQTHVTWQDKLYENLTDIVDSFRCGCYADCSAQIDNAIVAITNKYMR